MWLALQKVFEIQSMRLSFEVSELWDIVFLNLQHLASVNLNHSSFWNKKCGSSVSGRLRKWNWSRLHLFRGFCFYTKYICIEPIIIRTLIYYGIRVNIQTNLLHFFLCRAVFTCGFFTDTITLSNSWKCWTKFGSFFSNSFHQPAHCSINHSAITFLKFQRLSERPLSQMIVFLRKWTFMAANTKYISHKQHRNTKFSHLLWRLPILLSFLLWRFSPERAATAARIERRGNFYYKGWEKEDSRQNWCLLSKVPIKAIIHFTVLRHLFFYYSKGL